VEGLEKTLHDQVNAQIVSLTHHELKPDLLVHTGPDLMGMAVQRVRTE